MSKAAGVLFVSNNGNALFLRRTESAPDFPGAWDFPGGGQEGETETAEITAIRETREEIGFLPDGKRFFHTRTASPATFGVGVGSAGPELHPVSPGPPDSVAAPPIAPAVMPDVDFTTFVQRVTNEFIPELNSEHDGYAWAPIGSPPEPLHPGCRIALDRLDMNELGVARAIADGRLTSPQRYENLWLFAIRITGTNIAYRPKHEEFVHRDPANYLNPEFLARCNGLPVIFKHPKEAPILNAEEFSKRIVGTVFLPYVAGDEVWAVVKIWIDDVADLMAKEGLSTSPGVNFANFSVNTKITLDDGNVVLFEGDPSLVDHIAICELGVWDKGGEPAGIRSESREDSMTESEEKAAADKAKKDADEKAMADAKAKKDAEDKEREDKAKRDAAAKKDGDAGVGEKLDKVLSHLDNANTKLDAFGKRLDAVEGKDKDRDDAAKKDADEKSAKEKEEAEKAAADKAKKDAEDKEKSEAKEREDKAKMDSAALRDEIKRIEGLIPKSIGDADFHAIQDSQARADEIYALFGKHAPRPLAGDTVPIYERRIVREMKNHSPRWKEVDVSTAFADEAAFGKVRDQVYEDARKDAMSPSTAPDGGLRQLTKRGASGHTIHEYVGDSRAWMYPFAGPTRQYANGRFDDSSVRGGRRG